MLGGAIELFIFLLLTGGMVALSRRQPTHVQALSWILGFIWILSTIALFFHAAFIVGPVLDLAAGLFTMLLFYKRPDIWIMVMALSFAAQIGAHANYREGNSTPDRQLQLLNELSLLYIVQLLLVVGGPRVGQIAAFLQNQFGGPRGNHRVRWAARAGAKAEAKSK